MFVCTMAVPSVLTAPLPTAHNCAPHSHRPVHASISASSSPCPTSPGVDGVVKFWDLRCTGAPVGEAAPWLELERLCDACVPPISQKQHGITSLALHPQGGWQLAAPGEGWQGLGWGAGAYCWGAD